MAADLTSHRPTLRVVRILEAVSNAPSEGLTLAQIGRYLSAPSSSLLPFVKTLCACGYLSQDDRTMTYTLGARCLGLAASFENSSDVYSAVRREIEKAVQEAGEICQVGVRDGDSVYYVAKVDAPHALRLVSSVGKRVPAPCTALGKALLCEEPREAIEAMWPQGLPTLTEFSIRSMDVFCRQLEAVRSGDFATDINESLLHLRCFALPVRVHGRIDCAVSISTPDFRMTPAKEALVKQVLLETRGRIEKKLSLLGRGLSGGPQEPFS